MLHTAVAKDNTQEVNRLLKISFTNVNERDKFLQTPLHVAAYKRNKTIVKALIERGADVNAKDRNQWTPLLSACSSGDLNVIDMLLNHPKVDVKSPSKDGTSALHYLVRIKAPEGPALDKLMEILDKVTQKGGDLNLPGKHGETPLHQAVFRGNTPVVKWLISRKCKINAQNKIGETALHYAVRNNSKEMCRLLLDSHANASVKSNEGTPVELATALNLENLLVEFNKEKAHQMLEMYNERYDLQPETQPEQQKYHHPAQYQRQIDERQQHVQQQQQPPQQQQQPPPQQPQQQQPQQANLVQPPQFDYPPPPGPMHQQYPPGGQFQQNPNSMGPAGEQRDRPVSMYSQAPQMEQVQQRPQSMMVSPGQQLEIPQMMNPQQHRQQQQQRPQEMERSDSPQFGGQLGALYGKSPEEIEQKSQGNEGERGVSQNRPQKKGPAGAVKMFPTMMRNQAIGISANKQGSFHDPLEERKRKQEQSQQQPAWGKQLKHVDTAARKPAPKKQEEAPSWVRKPAQSQAPPPAFHQQGMSQQPQQVQQQPPYSSAPPPHTVEHVTPPQFSSGGLADGGGHHSPHSSGGNRPYGSNGVGSDGAYQYQPPPPGDNQPSTASPNYSLDTVEVSGDQTAMLMEQLQNTNISDNAANLKTQDITAALAGLQQTFRDFTPEQQQELAALKSEFNFDMESDEKPETPAPAPQEPQPTSSPYGSQQHVQQQPQASPHGSQQQQASPHGSQQQQPFQQQQIQQPTQMQQPPQMQQPQQMQMPGGMMQMPNIQPGQQMSQEQMQQFIQYQMYLQQQLMQMQQMMGQQPGMMPGMMGMGGNPQNSGGGPAQHQGGMQPQQFGGGPGTHNSGGGHGGGAASAQQPGGGAPRAEGAMQCQSCFIMFRYPIGALSVKCPGCRSLCKPPAQS